MSKKKTQEIHSSFQALKNIFLVLKPIAVILLPILYESDLLNKAFEVFYSVANEKTNSYKGKNMDTVYAFNVDKLHIKIVRDEDPVNPRENDNLGEILYNTSLRYKLGDRNVSSKELDEITKRTDVIWLPMYVCMHGGIFVNTTGFSDIWDTAVGGIIYVTLDKIRKGYNKKRITKRVRDSVEDTLNHEIETYNFFINKDVYGFIIEDDTHTELDSCFGFYGLDVCKQAALTVAKDLAASLK